MIGKDEDNLVAFSLKLSRVKGAFDRPDLVVIHACATHAESLVCIDTQLAQCVLPCLEFCGRTCQSATEKYKTVHKRFTR